MRELKRAIRELERAYRRSIRFAERTERHDAQLAARARAEAADVARVIGEYRLLLSLGADADRGVTARSRAGSVERSEYRLDDEAADTAEADRDPSR